MRMCVDGHRYPAHRLAWLYMTGEWPGEVDHINGKKDDNRWANLRDISHAANSQNVRVAQVNNRCGVLGVKPLRDKFQARICVARKTIHLGTFLTTSEAHAAYVAAKRELHEGCTL
jgi:hypothetical protein